MSEPTITITAETRDEILRKLEGVAIYSDVATAAQCRSEEEGDEMDREATVYYLMRNDNMRDIWRLLAADETRRRAGEGEDEDGA